MVLLGEEKTIAVVSDRNGIIVMVVIDRGDGVCAGTQARGQGILENHKWHRTELTILK